MREVKSGEAPAPVGPYAQATEHAGTLYLSGQIPIDPATGSLEEGDVSAQTERVMSNLAGVLREAGSGWERVLRVTIYLTEMADFQDVNAVYERVLAGARPARATVAVSALPLGARIEMDAIAIAESR